MTASEPKRKIRNDGRVSYEMITCYHGAFRFYAQQFYVGRKKHIPKLFSKMITSRSLAIWFMDDGSKKSAKHKTYVIHTLGYSFADLQCVQVGLKKVFGLDVAIHKQKNKLWRLYIPSQSAQAFKELVFPVMKQIPSMLYKLGNEMPKK